MKNYPYLDRRDGITKIWFSILHTGSMKGDNCWWKEIIAKQAALTSSNESNEQTGREDFPHVIFENRNLGDVIKITRYQGDLRYWTVLTAGKLENGLKLTWHGLFDINQCQQISMFESSGGNSVFLTVCGLCVNRRPLASGRSTHVNISLQAKRKTQRVSSHENKQTDAVPGKILVKTLRSFKDL